MAKRRRLSATPAVRGGVREGVRRGEGDAKIIADMEAKWPSVKESILRRTLDQERKRQEVVDLLTTRDKRRNMDVAAELQCPPSTSRIRMSVTVLWKDPNTKVDKKFGTTIEVPAQGRLGDILNAGISQVIQAARDKGYDPGRITSANTTGSSRFRIEYAECI